MERRTYQIGDARLRDPDGADNVAPAAVISWLEGAAADRAQAAHGKCESTQSQTSPTSGESVSHQHSPLPTPQPGTTCLRAAAGAAAAAAASPVWGAAAFA